MGKPSCRYDLISRSWFSKWVDVVPEREKQRERQKRRSKGKAKDEP